MSENKCYRIDKQRSIEYETVQIAKTDNVCPMCEDYAKKHSAKPVAVICCEGACLRGGSGKADGEYIMSSSCSRENRPYLFRGRLY